MGGTNGGIEMFRKEATVGTYFKEPNARCLSVPAFLVTYCHH